MKTEVVSAYLASCGLSASGTMAEWRAAERLCGKKASTENLVLALHALDCQLRNPIDTYSALGAVTADADDYGYAVANRADGLSLREQAERRHARREGEALAAVVALDPATELRRRLIAALQERGVRIETDACLGVVSHLASAIRMRRAIQAANMKNVANRSGNAPMLAQCNETLAAAGV